MLTIIIAIFSILALLCLIRIRYEINALSVTRYEVCQSRLPKEANGTNFLVIADLHSNLFGAGNSLLVKKIDEIHPDFIIIAGDLFISKEYSFDIAYDLLTNISKKYTIYYGFGNHEQKLQMFEKEVKIKNEYTNKYAKDNHRMIQSFHEFITKVRDLGVIVLDNNDSIIELENQKKIRIFGGSIGLEYFKRFQRPNMTLEYLESQFSKSSTSDYEILIAHNPMYFKVYSQWGADLVLSGHIHGGMVRLPWLGGIISPQMQIFPKYDGGLYTWDKDGKESKMIVSRGLGIHTLKIRLWNRPELVHVTLLHKD